jgi:hypothetical protein
MTHISVRHFHATVGVQQRPDHSLYPMIQWEKVSAGFIAVVDPIDNNAILYLSEQAYQIQVRVTMSQASSLIVLARPGDKAVDSSAPSTSSNPSSSENSPIPNISKRNSQVWKKFLSWHLSSLTGLTGAKRRRSSSEGTVATTATVLQLLIPYWGLDLHFRLGGEMNPPRTLVVALRQLADRMVHLLKNHGPQEFILRMKGALFMLNRRLANPKEDADPWLLGTPIGLSRSRLPKLIPLLLRRHIVQENPVYIRMLTSIFNGYKAMEGKHAQQDLQSIIGEHPILDEVYLTEFRTFCKEVFWKQVVRSNCSPSQWREISNPILGIGPDSGTYIPTRAGPNGRFGLFGAPVDAFAWTLEPVNWPLVWAEHVGDTRTPEVFHRCVSNLTSELVTHQRGGQALTGKIELLPEPAGKVRAIAIADYWTQRLMSPVHDWMMSVLKTLPTDGTFDQEEATESFARFLSITGKKAYSIDLKSATDLIPIELYRAVLTGIWGPETTEIWISLLTDRWFKVPEDKPRNPSLAVDQLKGAFIRYGRGQPMGTLSSWPSMSLVHHALTTFSAYKAGYDPGLFVEYRVLGDDNVIAGQDVADSYIKTCNLLCVPTSPAKTLSGDLFIFASQIYLKGKNLSPLSLKEELGIRSYGQRLEMALRAMRRGWLDNGRTLPRFLRLLLTRSDYRRQARQWSLGKLGKIAQSALVSAFGIAKRSVLDLLGFQGSGFKPFLLSLENKVEALAGDQSRLANFKPSERKARTLKVKDESQRQLERAIAVATAAALQRQLQAQLERLRVASIRFSMWSDSVGEVGFLPRFSWIRTLKSASGKPGPLDAGILAVPHPKNDASELAAVWGRGGPCWDGAPMPDQEYYYTHESDPSTGKPVCPPRKRRIGPAIDPLTGGYKKVEEVYSPIERVFDRSLWVVIYDSYFPLLGKIASETNSQYDYSDVVAEEQSFGIGMSPNLSIRTDTAKVQVTTSPSGWRVKTPSIEVKVRLTRDRVAALIDQLVRAPDAELGDPWLVLDELAKELSAVCRIPDFTKISDFYAEVPRDPDLLRPWVQKATILTEVLKYLPFGVDFTTPLKGELPLGPSTTKEATDTIRGAEFTAKTNHGLLTGSPTASFIENNVGEHQAASSRQIAG